MKTVSKVFNSIDLRSDVLNQVHIADSEKPPNLDILVDKRRSKINLTAVFPDHVRVETSPEVPFPL